MSSVHVSYPPGTHKCANPVCDRYSPRSEYCKACQHMILAPKAEAPEVEAPNVEAPNVEAPEVEAPKVEAPNV